MIYHIVVGDEAAEPLKEAINSGDALQGTIVVLKDLLHLGPIEKNEGASFSSTRSAFWAQMSPQDKPLTEVNDLETILEISTAMNNDDSIQAWFWMAPWPADVCVYYWLLQYLSKHISKLYVVNINGLPFLDVNGKVYYPKNISQILPKELIKARKLARLVTPSEMEVDTDEWKKLLQENAGIRTHEGGKKLLSRNENHYDNILLSFCSHQFQKASRIITQSLNKFNVPTGDVYLGWRLKKMAEQGALIMQGDTSKTLRDFDVKLPGEALVVAEQEVTA
jgi:Protein of unknown function/Domain of unknown function (DUF1835)